MKNDNLIYDWLDYVALQKSHKKTIKEDKIRDFVSGRNIAVATDVGAIDVEFKSLSGDFIQMDPTWVSQNIQPVQLINGGKVSFHKKYAEVLKKAFESACRATGWTPENPKAGYCPRPNGGFVQRRSRAKDQSSKPNNEKQIGGHAWGTSIDVGTASENPMGGGGKIREFPQFINAMKQGGFIWGGDWKYPDDMHFEVNVGNAPAPSPSELGDTHHDQENLEGADEPSGSGMGMGSFARNVFGSLVAESLDRKIFKINDESKNNLYKKYQKYFDSLLEYLKKELKLTKPVKINFLNDEKNANKVLGKTGSYINHKEELVIYTTGRHIKDIMRSLSHELVHHRQNIRGEFKGHEPTKHGYAQSNEHLRKMEKEAYLKGNILFRDWEDNYKYRGDK